MGIEEEKWWGGAYRGRVRLVGTRSEKVAEEQGGVGVLEGRRERESVNCGFVWMLPYTDIHLE